MHLKKIYLIHHTHFDIGFTDLPQEVWQQQERHLDNAVAIAERDKDFRWTIESGSLLRKYLNDRNEIQQQQIIRLLQEKRFELQGFDMQSLTETLSFAELTANLSRPAMLGRKYNFPVECATLDDIGGFTGALPKILNEYGIRYLILGVGACQAELPWADLPHLFYLKNRNGGKVLAWNLGIDRQEESCNSKYPYAVYGLAANYFGYRAFPELLGIKDMGINFYLNGEDRDNPLKYEEMFEILCQRLERENYPYSEIMLQYGGDNRGPSPYMAELVRKINASGKLPQIEFVTPSVFMHIMEEKYGADIPEISGLLTDPWTIRMNAVPSTLKKYRKAQREAKSSALLGFNSPELLESMMLTGDHTFGMNNWGWHDLCNDDRGGLRGEIFDRMRESWRYKKYYGEDAFYRAGELMRKAHGKFIASSQEVIAVKNNSPYTVSGDTEFYLGCYAPELEKLLDNGKDIPFCKVGENRYVIYAENVPPVSALQLVPVFSNQYNVAYQQQELPVPEKIENGKLTLLFKADGAVVDIMYDDRKVADCREFSFAEITAEEIKNYPMNNEHCNLLPASDRELKKCVINHAFLSADNIFYTEIKQYGNVASASFTRVLKIWKNVARIDINVRFDKPESKKKEFYYTALPFSGKGGRFFFNQNSGIASPQRLLPGAMQDMFFCADYAALDNGDFTAVLSCPDAPVVEFGGITSMQWRKTLPFAAHNNHIFALAFNNICNTDAPAWFEVLDTFEYSLYFDDSSFSAAKAEKFCRSNTVLTADWQFGAEYPAFPAISENIKFHLDDTGAIWLENLTADDAEYDFEYAGHKYSGKIKSFELKKI